jgi:hypothetical protein
MKSKKSKEKIEEGDWDWDCDMIKKARERNYWMKRYDG